MPDDAHGLAALRVLILWFRAHYPRHCFYCGRVLRRKRVRKFGRQAFNQHTMDHVIPRVRGGASAGDNTVPCCASCNNVKDDWSLEKFRTIVSAEAWLLDGKFFGERQYSQHFNLHAG